MKIDLKIPNLGEAEDTEIIEVSISKGEQIKKNGGGFSSFSALGGGFAWFWRQIRVQHLSLIHI